MPIATLLLALEVLVKLSIIGLDPPTVTASQSVTSMSTNVRGESVKSTDS